MQFESFNTAADWPDDPISLFADWFQFAQQNKVPEPEAMALATSDRTGKPSVRMVLLRGFDERGFCFYTNYLSRKGVELTENPHAATVFYWREPYLQVRIEGSVQQLSAEESDAYFLARTRAKRLSAIVSNQSRPVDDWRSMEIAAKELADSADPALRPAHWGGYRLSAELMEFWAGRQDRMHRRCVYKRVDATWNREMQAP